MYLILNLRAYSKTTSNDVVPTFREDTITKNSLGISTQKSYRLGVNIDAMERLVFNSFPVRSYNFNMRPV